MSARCALIALAVAARGAPEPPCTAEARAYCRESRTSRAIERCLLAHADRLGPLCAARARTLATLHDACEAEIARFACKDDHVVTCLRDVGVRAAARARPRGAGTSRPRRPTRRR